jgi:hypothetical protein
VALAHAPTVTLDPIGNLGPYAPTDFPVVYNVTGTIAHEQNVTSISELKLFIDDIQEGVTVNPNFGNDASAPFSLPWSIVGPGTYEVKVTAKHGNETGEDSEEVTVLSDIIVVTECPAAPAIAADYLMNTLHWKPVSGKFKTIMKLVAAETGSKGSLWAAHACDPGYAAATIAFVNSKI